MREKTFGALVGFMFGAMVAVLIWMSQTMVEMSHRIDDIQRVNEIQNGLILELYHSK